MAPKKTCGLAREIVSLTRGLIVREGVSAIRWSATVLVGVVVVAALGATLRNANTSRDAAHVVQAPGAPTPAYVGAEARGSRIDASLVPALAPGSMLSGRVTDVGGRPVPHAELILASAESRRAIRTGRDGGFVIEDVTAGEYVLKASKETFVARYYGQSDENDVVQVLGIEGRSGLNHLTIRMTRGGVITGRIADEFGDLVVGALVVSVRATSAEAFAPAFASLIQGKLPLTIESDSRSALTDDRGVFRIYGIRPGKYRVVATRGASPNRMGQTTAESLPAYFPGTNDFGLAVSVSVTAGGEANASFTLPTARPVVINGAVINSEGKPVSGAAVRVMRMLGRQPWRGAPIVSVASGPNGTFQAPVLPEREYVIYASDRSPWSKPGVQADIQLGRAYVSVGRDVAPRVTITTRPGATISGTVTGLRGEDGTALRVVPVPIGADNIAAGVTASAAVNPNGTFELHNVFGHTLLSVGSAADGPVVAGVSANGVDVTDSGFNLDSGAKIDQVVIRLARHQQQLIGTVRAADGGGADAVVLLFATDQAKWAHPEGRYIKVTKSNALGRFVFGGIPPGTYNLVAVPGLRLDEDLTRTSLSQLRRRAVHVRLEEESAIVNADVEMW